MNRIRLVCAMILCSNYLYSMEVESSSFTYTYGKTEINCVKGNIEDFDKKAAVIVVGENKLFTSYFWDRTKNIIVSGVEPEIYNICDKHSQDILCYHRFLQASSDGNVRLHKYYQGEQAIKRAEKELYRVYQNALILGNLRRLKKNNPDKTIAMPLLGTTYFPRDKAAKCAISAIMNRITQYPGDYDRMYVVVNSETDVAECKKLLEGYIR
jgi:hypothetical protein